MIHFVLNGSRQYDPRVAYWFVLCACIFILAVNVGTRITQKMELDANAKTLTINYLTLFKGFNQIVLPLRDITISYKIAHIRGQNQLPYELKLYRNGKKVHSLVTGFYGFSAEQIDGMVKELETLGVSYK